MPGLGALISWCSISAKKKNKTSNVPMSSPISKKKLTFTHKFPTLQTEQDFEAGNLEEQEQCSAPFGDI